VSLVVAFDDEKDSSAYTRIEWENSGRASPMAADQAKAILTASICAMHLSI
jgi:hypothetical protein